MHHAHVDAAHDDGVGCNQGSDDERDEVARHRDRVLEPDPFYAALEHRSVDGRAIREGRQPCRHVEGDREDRLAVGLVEAREGSAGVGGLELGGGYGARDAFGVDEGRAVEAVQLIVQGPQEPDRDLEGPGADRLRKAQREPLGVGVDPHGRFEVAGAGAHPRPCDGQLSCIQENLGETLSSSRRDAHLAREGSGHQVRCKAQVIAVGLDRVGQSVSCGGRGARQPRDWSSSAGYLSGCDAQILDV